MKRFIPFTALLALFLAACGPAATKSAAATPTSSRTTITPRTLTVFAAASLTDAFKEIGATFEATHPGVTVKLNFAGSQTLRTQIEQGAEPDVFASANTKEMNTLIDDGIINRADSQIFLNNKLVVILPTDNPAGLSSLEDLARPGIKLDLAAKDVPVGNYSRQALGLMDTSFGKGFKDKVMANVVSNEENVKLVVAKVQLGEVDAGMVYTSDAVAAPELGSIKIPNSLNVIAEYPIAPLIGAPNPKLAAQFISFVLSPDGQAILHKWGFLSPK